YRRAASPHRRAAHAQPGAAAGPCCHTDTRAPPNCLLTCTGMIKEKSVYDPAEPDDGYRVLVMRVVRDKSILERRAFDIWMRSLGPRVDSLKRWWDGTIDTAQFYTEFRQHATRP